MSSSKQLNMVSLRAGYNSIGHDLVRKSAQMVLHRGIVYGLFRPEKSSISRLRASYRSQAISSQGLYTRRRREQWWLGSSKQASGMVSNAGLEQLDGLQAPGGAPPDLEWLEEARLTSTTPRS